MSSAAQKRLVEFALHTAAARIRGESDVDAPSLQGLPKPFGLFVTLRVATQLRGCIGRVDAIGDLVSATRELTLAALHDARFVHCPIHAAEIPALHVELSLLGALRPVHGPHEIRIGEHGILVEGRGRRGLFLPQVATERGMDAEGFLAACCRHKLGLPGGAWRSPGFVLQIFSTELWQGGWIDVAAPGTGA